MFRKPMLCDDATLSGGTMVVLLLLLSPTTGCRDATPTGPEEELLLGTLCYMNDCCDQGAWSGTSNCAFIDPGRRYDAQVALYWFGQDMWWNGIEDPECWAAYWAMEDWLAGEWNVPGGQAMTCEYDDGWPGVTIIATQGTSSWAHRVGFRRSLFSDPWENQFLGATLWHEGAHIAFPHWDEVLITGLASLCETAW